MTCTGTSCNQGRKPCTDGCTRNSDGTSRHTGYYRSLFNFEYRRQRFMGRGVIRSAWNAIEYALQPLPF